MNLKKTLMKASLFTGLLGMLFPQVTNAAINTETKSLISSTSASQTFNPIITVVDKTAEQNNAVFAGGRCPACSRCLKDVVVNTNL